MKINIDEIYDEMLVDLDKYNAINRAWIDPKTCYERIKEAGALKKTHRIMGWPGFCQVFGGLRGGELTMLTGDTAHGKTTYGMNLLFGCINSGITSCLFSLEMGADQGLNYMVPMVQATSEAGGKPLDRWMEEAPLLIWDGSGPEDFDLITKSIIWASMSKQSEVFLIDHFHSMTKPTWDAAQIERAAMILRQMATQLNVSIVCIVHPSKIQGDRKERVIEMDDLKGSSGLKQYADNVISVFRNKQEKKTTVHFHKIRDLEYGRYSGAKIDYKLNYQSNLFEEVGGAADTGD